MQMLVADPKDLETEFLNRITDPDFPCVGAKSAVAKDHLKVLAAHNIGSGWDDLRIHRELIDWVEDYRRNPKNFRSLAVIFEGPDDLDEISFETAMWERLQSLADKDYWLGQPYDRRVNADAEDPHFSLSFGGEAFFVVGLHPQASRPARRFRHPALVFNLHDQFERLRAEGKYERMRDTILVRDRKLSGSLNPMLALHGESSEARQYSGRCVEEDWRCPFHDPRAEP